MMSVVLQQLEVLQSQLDTIDPTREIDAADKVAALAVALRDTLAEAELSRGARGASEEYLRLAK